MTVVRPFRSPGVGIVGGGLLGLGLAHRLTGMGVPVTVYERAARVGGLAGTTVLGGYEVDRFYHAITTADHRVLDLAEAMGLRDTMRFRPLGAGFYHDGRLASMSTPADVLRFPGLGPADKARLAAFALRCRREREPERLDGVPVEDYVRRTAGDRLWTRLWAPLLDSKFDGRYDDIPATYLWSRMRRVSGTRDRAGREIMGWIRGGYQVLADRLAEDIRARGGEVLTGTPVHLITSELGRVSGVVTPEGARRHDWVVTTQLRPNIVPLLTPDVAAALPPDPCRYMGVVCVVARVSDSVSPYYALNITDRRIPLTSVVETTHVVDPEHVGGHLLYVPRYVRADSPELDRPSGEIVREYLGHVSAMFPGFRAEDVIASQVARARVAEPVHRTGTPSGHPDVVPVPGLLCVSAANAHPDIVHGQAVLGVAERAARQLARRLATDTSVTSKRSAA